MLDQPRWGLRRRVQAIKARVVFSRVGRRGRRLGRIGVLDVPRLRLWRRIVAVGPSVELVGVAEIGHPWGVGRLAENRKNRRQKRRGNERVNTCWVSVEPWGKRQRRVGMLDEPIRRLRRRIARLRWDRPTLIQPAIHTTSSLSCLPRTDRASSRTARIPRTSAARTLDPCS